MPDTPSTINFTYHDPGRCFDGTPYEAAGKAVGQILGLTKLTRTAIAHSYIQARNAWMQRNIDLGGTPNAEEWEDSPEAKVFKALRDANEATQKKLTALQRSVSYDPAHPPKD